MNTKARKMLELFQCDLNRTSEEDFAQAFSENDAIRLFFINEGQAFTDGKSIVVDPGCDELFCDVDALFKTEEYMKIEHDFSSDIWCALRMVTRGQTVHEALHILYTSFPLPIIKDERNSSKARGKTLSLINNIIEDAFIEAAGCSVFDNLELYLILGRISRLFSNTPSEGTVSRAFEEELKAPKTRFFQKPSKGVLITKYLNYMCTFLLYPMVKLEKPDKAVAKYVKLTKQLFLDGSICGVPEERYKYSQRVFDIIEDLIPDSDELIDEKGLERMLGGLKTHSINQAGIGSISSRGKIPIITRRLTLDIDGKPINGGAFKNQINDLIKEFLEDKNNLLQIISYSGSKIELSGDKYDCAQIHKGINIIEENPKINRNLKKAYQNIYNKYKININSYNSRFAQLLKADIISREEKHVFGSGISSKHMGDVKKRYWYRNVQRNDITDIAILLMIDGSGSMDGERRNSAIISSVILHEVLKKQGILHSIVEQRAIYEEPEVHHNILVDFASAEDEKYNILMLDAAEGTREGLSLYWAEKYIAQHTSSAEKLIIMLSDGVPAHRSDHEPDYVPPVSIQDTKNAVNKIIKRGTKIVAVALEENSNSCSDELRQMYPHVIECNDLKRLTGQLLELVSRQFRN